MSTGTKIVQNALSDIGAHSIIKPASPESIEIGKDMLNSMIARWADDEIEFGAVPLEAAGDELSEPVGLTNTITFNLAIELHPLFPGSQISPALQVSANKTFQDMLTKSQTVVIPKQVVRETLPVGQGNKDRNIARDRTFFRAGETVGS